MVAEGGVLPLLPAYTHTSLLAACYKVVNNDTILCAFNPRQDKTAAKLGWWKQSMAEANVHIG
jgi:hypothetical protein